MIANEDIEALRVKLKSLRRAIDPQRDARIKAARASFKECVRIYFSAHVRLPETSKFRADFYKNEAKLSTKNRHLLFKAYR